MCWKQKSKEGGIDRYYQGVIGQNHWVDMVKPRWSRHNFPGISEFNSNTTRTSTWTIPKLVSALVMPSTGLWRTPSAASSGSCTSQRRSIWNVEFHLRHYVIVQFKRRLFRMHLQLNWRQFFHSHQASVEVLDLTVFEALSVTTTTTLFYTFHSRVTWSSSLARLSAVCCSLNLTHSSTHDLSV